MKSIRIRRSGRTTGYLVRNRSGFAVVRGGQGRGGYIGSVRTKRR